MDATKSKAIRNASYAAAAAMLFIAVLVTSPGTAIVIAILSAVGTSAYFITMEVEKEKIRQEEYKRRREEIDRDFQKKMERYTQSK